MIFRGQADVRRQTANPSWRLETVRQPSLDDLVRVKSSPITAQTRIDDVRRVATSFGRFAKLATRPRVERPRPHDRAGAVSLTVDDVKRRPYNCLRRPSNLFLWGQHS